MPVVRADGRWLARSVYGHVITKFSRMGRLPHFLSYGALPSRVASRRASSSAKNRDKHQLKVFSGINKCLLIQAIAQG